MVGERESRSDGRPPLHVLTGFLGSGKTTVLAELLRSPAARGTAVLVNEVAELPLDAHLLERVDDEVLALPSGCLCCELRGELHTALARVLDRAPVRVVIETTGLAEPGPVLVGIAEDRALAPRLRPGAVVAVADALRLEELIETESEVRAQLDAADRIVLTKADLAPGRVERTRALLADVAPGREVRGADHGRIDPAWLLDAPAFAGLADAAAATRWLRHVGRPTHDLTPDETPTREPRAHAARAHALTLEAPADIEALQLWLRLVTQLDGPRLLRIKLLAECRATGVVHVLQAAGRSLSPPRALARPPVGVGGVQAVVVERGLSDGAVERLLAALRSAAAGRSAGRADGGRA